MIAKIKLLLHELESKNLLKSVDKIDLFYDEPKFFQNSVFLNINNQITDGLIPQNPASGSGISFTSKHYALLKCVGEGIERLCLYSFKKKSFIFDKYSKLKNLAIDPAIYNNNLHSFVFGWKKGYNISQNLHYLIPAQLVYLNFRHTFKEKYISANISTGTAGGFDHESTLLRGIYEVVERDAYMTNYLAKIKVPRISIDYIDDPILLQVIKILKRYNLNPYLFDITNDLGISTFLTLLIDTTRKGPAIALGTKASLDSMEAVLGSMEEATLYRIWIKYEMYGNKSGYTINPSQIKSLGERGLYWAPYEMIKELKYLLQQKLINKKIQRSSLSIKNQLVKVKELLKSKGLDIYYTDITLPIFKQSNYLVYKVLIPHLQPLYLDERMRELNMKRLKEVARFFGKKKIQINTIPHPFI